MKLKKSKDYKRDVFSISKANAFSRCPRYAFYRYIVGLKEPPSEALLLGRGAHSGQEYDNLERIKGNRPKLTEVLDRAVEAYEAEGGGNPDDFFQQHRKQLEAFWESGERDKIQPVPGTVEAPFEVELECTADPDSEPKEPATVQGFVDVVSDTDRRPVVIDYKTVGRPVTDKDAESSVQADLYMLGAECSRAKFVSFVKYQKQKPTTKVTKVVHLIERKIDRLLTFLNDTITSFRKNMKSGDWPKCAPSCFWCSPTACGFYGRCYPEKDPHLSNFVSIKDVKPVGTLEQPKWRKERRAKDSKVG